MAAPAPDFEVVFRSSALEPSYFHVRELRGREGLSQLFEFEVLVECTGDEPPDFRVMDEIVRGQAYVAFGAEHEHKIFGVVRRITLVSMSEPKPVLFRLLFVPRLHDLTQTRGSWVYQDMSVPEIVFDVLKEAGFEMGKHFEFRLVGSYPKREYVVQYEESDFQFVSRLMEHAGLFYFFEHSDAGATLVVTDSNEAAQRPPGMEVIGYDPRGGTSAHTEVVTALELTQTVVPRHVVVRDYNYRTPAVPMTGDSPVDPQLGAGLQVYYGEHFKDPGEGKRLARVRAEELLARKYTLAGRSRVRGLRAGQRFELADHPFSSLNIEFLVTEIVHAVTQLAVEPGVQTQQRAYANELTLVPASVAYRPVRATPRPRIHGVIHATIDAPADDGKNAPIDENGRYKVLLPHDIAGRNGGRASRWVRMAQPASGAEYGVHFPLHPGIEVMLVHIDGDPDRPVIVGSVPNAQTRSPVTQTNASQSEMKTRGGIRVTFDDAVNDAFPQG